MCVEAENISTIEAVKGRRWGIKLQCSSCNEKTDKFVFVDESEEAEVDGGTCNNVVSCKFCKKQMSTNVETKQYGVVDVTLNKPGQVIAFTCRGGEPVEALLEDQWIVTAAQSDKQFTEGVLLDEDWCDYDDKGDQSVSILGATASFERKGK